MSSDAVHEIEKVFNDLDYHKNLHHVDKYVPRGSQEFREALMECKHDTEDQEPEQRERSRTLDSTYKKSHLSVHFASNLETPSGKKTRSKDDLHNHMYPDGILRRNRSNTYDGTVTRPKNPARIQSPPCNGNTIMEYNSPKPERKGSVKKEDKHSVEGKVKAESATKKTSSNSSLNTVSSTGLLQTDTNHTKQSSPKISRKSKSDSSS